MTLKHKIFICLLFPILVGGCSISSSINAPFQLQWSQTIGSGSAGQYLKLSPVIVGNKIFANSYDGKIAAIDLVSGKKIWEINSGFNLTSGLAAQQNKLLVGTRTGQILALNQNDGEIAWMANLTGEISAVPSVAPNMVIVKSANGLVKAFNLTDGKERWSYTHNEPLFILRGGGALQIAQNLVAAPFANGEMVILNLTNGQIIWQELLAESSGNSAVERLVDIAATPQIKQNIIYAVTHNGRLAALDLTTGTPLWQHELSATSGLIADDNQIYVPDDQGWVWAFDCETGEVMWKETILSGHTLSAPLTTENSVIVADTSGFLYFFAKNNGSLQSKLKITNQEIVVSPLIVNHDLYIYTQEGRLLKITSSS